MADVLGWAGLNPGHWIPLLTRVLIVDDDPQFRRTLRIALTTLGYEVADAASGSEAMESMKASLPDIILIDWQMPDMDGLQTCQAVRGSYDVPVMIITGNRANPRAKAMAAGASAFLTKPFSVQDLMARIESTLKH